MEPEIEPPAPGPAETSHPAGPATVAGQPEPAAEDGQPERPPAIPLLEPRDGLPPLVASPGALSEAVRALSAGEGRSPSMPSGRPVSAMGTGLSWSSSAGAEPGRC